jgi:glycosyltransferase involved in cell wall biosynthesis/tetratricopeptide (TPR) repeat protein
MRLLSLMGKTQEASIIINDVKEYAFETKNFSICLQIGRWYSENSNTDQALELFRKCKEFDSTRSDPDLYMGRLLYNKKRYSESRIIWQSLISKNYVGLDLYEPNIFLARIAYFEKKYEDAKSYIKTAIEFNNDSIEPYKLLIRIASSQRNFYEARKLAYKFSQRFPLEAEFKLILAQATENEGDLGKADVIWSDLFNSFGHTLNWDKLYDSYLIRTDRVKEALTFWEDRETEGNVSQSSQYLRAKHLVALDRKSEAIAILKAELDPVKAHHESGILLLANTYRELNQRPKALDAYYAGAKLFPTNATFWEGAISFCLDVNSKAKIIQFVEEALINFNLKVAEDCYSVARIYLAAEMLKKAEEHFLLLFEINPDHERGLRVMMRMLNAQGRTLDAKPYAFSLKQKNWMDIGATSTLAKAAILKKKGISLENGDISSPAIFSKISEACSSQPLLCDNRRVAIVTSSLGSGGAERQVAYTVKSSRTGKDLKSIIVLAEDLNPILGRDFFRKVIENTEHDIVEVGKNRDFLIRQLSAQFPECREDLAFLQTLEPEVSRFATPFYAWLKLNPIEVVHLWQDSINIAGGIAAVLAGVPKIIIATRSTRPDSRRRYRPYLKPGYKTLMKRPEVSMINNSKSGARDYEEWLDLEEGTVKIVHNGMDISMMKRRGNDKSTKVVRDKIGITDDNLVLGGVMRFTEEKRPDLFTAVAINAAKRDPRLRFFLIGDGPMRESLMNKVADEGLTKSIIMPGIIDPIEPWMRNFDILFLSSRMEGLPNVLLEAQCLGTPVATMNVGGAPETLIDGETGILINDTNPEIIASVILEKLYDKTWCKKASIIGQNHISKNFSIEVMSKVTRNLYIN